MTVVHVESAISEWFDIPIDFIIEETIFGFKSVLDFRCGPRQVLWPHEYFFFSPLLPNSIPEEILDGKAQNWQLPHCATEEDAHLALRKAYHYWIYDQMKYRDMFWL
jgi:hypothetical protein